MIIAAAATNPMTVLRMVLTPLLLEKPQPYGETRQLPSSCRMRRSRPRDGRPPRCDGNFCGGLDPRNCETVAHTMPYNAQNISLIAVGGGCDVRCKASDMRVFIIRYRSSHDCGNRVLAADVGRLNAQ